MPRKYSHLDASTRALMDDTDEERIRHIQKDRFIPYRAVNTILDLLEDPSEAAALGIRAVPGGEPDLAHHPLRQWAEGQFTFATFVGAWTLTPVH